MRTRSRFNMLMLLPVFAALTACGGGDGGSAPGGGGGGGGGTFIPGSFLPSSTYFGRCQAPRSGTSDRRGTVTDENNWLRSWTHETYLWYSEVTDRDPSLYNDPLVYFDLMKTLALSPSGQPKDKFHFTMDTEEWKKLSTGGIAAGYGAEFLVLAGTPPRNIVVAYVEDGTPAAGKLFRGDVVLLVDDQDAVNGNTNAVVDALNDGIFPSNAGKQTKFRVRNPQGVERDVTLTSANITHDPVPVVQTFNTTSGPVGYIQFNDHIATAEKAFMDAVAALKGQNVTDLILDLRYNGGGYLDIASQVAHMVANTTLTAGRDFERITFNDQHPNRDPVTGQTLVPTPFHTTTLGFTAGLAYGIPLPTLNLDRVYVITGPGTCSASESIINSLRGVNVQVYVIGSTTCGKPYGFYPTDNCGTTYFTIQFRGENAAGFGDYSDGFRPANQPGAIGEAVPGCSVADDFTHELGDPEEGRIAAALAFRASNNTTCPTATGFSPPQLSKASMFKSEGALVVSRPAARQNRILRRMR